MNINDILDRAFESQVHELFDIFVQEVFSNHSEESINAAAGRYKKGLEIVKTVLVKAKEIQ